jgi:hypothetical protein
MGDKGVRRTDLHTVIAFCASLEKKLLLHRTGRTQPVETNPNRGLLIAKAICFFDKFLRGFDGGENRIFQKSSPAV